MRHAGSGAARGFARVWTAATLARRLRAGRPLSVEVGGERLVFFRDAGGVAGALIDRCPHRGVRLSLGKVSGGCLECPFHAWRFATDGTNVEVPLNPDARRDRLGATALPVRELGGLLWVYTAPLRELTAPPPEPTLPDALTAPGLARTYLEVTWRAHWTRAMENMLDSPHVPYVHARTIGRFVRPLLKPGSRMDITWEPTAHGGLTTSTIDGGGKEDAGQLQFYKPNMMVLIIPIPRQTFRMHALCVPAGRDTVRMIVVGARSFARLPLLNPFFNYANLRIVREDQAVVESSEPAIVPPPSQELSVRTDRATLAFRKYYLDELAGRDSPGAKARGVKARGAKPERWSESKEPTGEA